MPTDQHVTASSATAASDSSASSQKPFSLVPGDPACCNMIHDAAHQHAASFWPHPVLLRIASLDNLNDQFIFPTHSECSYLCHLPCQGNATAVAAVAPAVIATARTVVAVECGRSGRAAAEVGDLPGAADWA